MKTTLFRNLAMIAAGILLASPSAYAATVLFNSTESGSYNEGTDLGGDGYGSSGFYFPSVEAVNGGTTFAVENTLTPAISVNADLTQGVQAAGNAYGTLPNGIFDFIGLAGPQTVESSTSTFNALTLTFNSGSFASYEVTLFTEGNGNNYSGANGITFTTTGVGADSDSNEVLGVPFIQTGYISGYSFDIANITQGDKVTITLSDPAYESLQYFGVTADALTTILAGPGTSTPEPSTYVLLGVGVLALFVMRRRQSTQS
jgi:hypothetical protein